VSNATLGGTPVLMITTTDDLMASGQHVVVSGISYQSQDPITGSTKLIADTRGPGNSLRNVTNYQVVSKGTFGAGFRSTSTITFDTGDTQTDGLNVQSHNFITVPSGAYNTWQEAVTKQDTNGQATDNIQWWAPEIGVVEATVHATQPGFENHITLKLISTNVTPPATPGAKVHPE